MNIYLRETNEINKRRKQLEKKRPKFYFAYFIVLICLAFIVDELATNVNNFLEDYVLDAYFKGNLNNYTIAITLCSAVSIFSFLYKVLADRFGRKPFLVINTIGMGAGMFICYISKNMPVYLIGLIIMFFFVPCDIHSVYVVETASEKHRAFWLSLTKAFAVASLAIIPALLGWAQKHNWQNVFLIPACIGFGLGVLCLFFIKESEPFLVTRIVQIQELRHTRSLKLTKEELKAKKVMDSQGGIVAGFKYILINKHLIWLFVVGVVFSLCTLASANFSVILLDGKYPMTEADYNLTLIIYPFVCAICEIIIGIISDKLGRKKATVTAGSFAIIGLLYFITAVNCDWYCQFTGIALGIFMGGYLAGIDTFTLMCAEQSPTNIRSSVMSIMSVSLSAGSLIGTLILLLANKISGDAVNVGYLSMCVVCPTLFIGVLILLSKMPETNRTDFATIKSTVLKEVRQAAKKFKKDNGVEQLKLFEMDEEAHKEENKDNDKDNINNKNGSTE